MLLINTFIKESSIHGVGLFAGDDIKKGTIVWEFTPGFDMRFTENEILGLPKQVQKYMCIYAWKSEKSGLYCFSSDNGKYFNHSDNPNVLSEYRDDKDEVVTIAIRDIKKGEELVDNYYSFESPKQNNNILDILSKKYGLRDESDPRAC